MSLVIHSEAIIEGVWRLWVSELRNALRGRNRGGFNNYSEAVYAWRIGCWDSIQRLVNLQLWKCHQVTIPLSSHGELADDNPSYREAHQILKLHWGVNLWSWDWWEKNNLVWMLYLVYAVLSICCTWCMHCSVHSVLSVCCTWCMLDLVYAVFGVNSWSWHGEIEKDDLTLYSAMMVELWTIKWEIVNEWRITQRIRVDPRYEVYDMLHWVGKTMDQCYYRPDWNSYPLYVGWLSDLPRKFYLVPVSHNGFRDFLSSHSFSSITPPSPKNMNLSNCSLSLQAMIKSYHWVHHTATPAYTEYSIHRVQHIPSTAYTEYSKHWVQYTMSIACTQYIICRVQHTPSTAHAGYSIHRVQNTPSIVYAEYSIHRVQHTQSTAYTEYSIHEVQHTLSTAYDEYSIHWVLHTVRTGSSQDRLSPAPCHSIISQKSMVDSILYIHTVTSLLMYRVFAPLVPPSRTAASTLIASKYSSNRTRSQRAHASRNLLDHGLQVHFQTRSITASKYISKLTHSLPTCASPNSLDYII